MANKLDKLVVEILADSATLKRDLAGVNQQLDSFGQRANRTLGAFKTAAIAAFGVFSTVAIKNAITGALDYADSIDKASKAAGVGAEFLQEFRFAAEQSGVSIQGTDDVLRRFNRRLGEFANSGGGPAAKAFNDLGISIRDIDGNVRGTEDVLQDVIRAMGSVETAAQKSALAAQLFGDDFGPKLLVLLDQGVDGIDRFRDAARDAGIVMEDELIANSVKAKDEMEKFGTILTVTKNKLILDYVPAMAEVAKAMNEAAQETGLLAAAWELLKGMSLTGPLGIISVTELSNLQQLNREIAQTDVQLRNLSAIPNTIGSGVDAEIQRLTLHLQDLSAARDKLVSQSGTIIRDRPDTQDTPAIPGTTGTTGGDKSAERAAKEAARAQQEFERSLQSLMDKLDPVAAKTRDYMTSVELLNRAWAEGQISGEVYDRLMAELAGNTEDATKAQLAQREAMEGLLRATIDAVDPTAALVRELEALDELMQSDTGAGFGEIIMERMLQIHEEMDGLGEKTEEVTSEMSVFAEQAARNMQGHLADFLFDPFDQGIEGMVKGFAQAMQRMLAEAAAAQIFEAMGFGGGNNPLSALIPGFATGTNYAPGGLALVGERGPELVHLPRGSQVTPNNRMGGDNISISVTVPPGSPAETRRAAAQGAREGVESMRRAQRYS